VKKELIVENNIIKEKVRIWNDKQKKLKTKHEMNDKMREEKAKRG
jgi:hypothetical protein